VRRLSLLAIGLLAACNKGPDVPEATRTDSSGVEIVMNPGPSRPLAWPVAPVDTIFDPAVDTILQGEARGVMVASDAQGRLVFVDGGFADRRVLRRELDGTIHQIGRRGGGPGEYEMVGGVAVSPSGEVLIGDFSKQGFVRFDAADRPLPLVKWSDIGGGFSRSGGYVGGALVAQLTDYGRGSGVEQRLMATEGGEGPRPKQILYSVTATDTVRVAQIEEPPMKMVMFESCKVGFAQSPLFFAGIQWTGNADQLAVTTGGDYRVDIWRGGKLFRSVRRDVPTRAVTRALAEQDLGEGIRIAFGGRPPCLIPPAEILEKQGFAPTLPAIKRLTMATDGTLWVERWTIKGEPMERDVFDPAGTYLGTFTGDIPWPQAWLPEGQFVAIGADADSLPVVVRYAVGGAVRRE
jgi:hypothetical protein